MRFTLGLAFIFSGVSSAVAQQAPTVHLINAPDATAKTAVGLAAAVRQLPNGKLLVNDIARRQIVLFDSGLATATVVADSVSGGASSYGPRPGGLVPYTGDSTLFIDPADLSMFVLDPNGAIARVAAVPRSQDAMTMGTNVNGTPGFDAHGRLVYRGAMRFTMGGPATKGAMAMPEPPDSAAILRVDVATRKVDTAAFIKISKIKMNVVQSDKGMSITSEINPMQTVDDWAVLSDGSIALVRGRDYHVDWVNADGTVTSSPKIPFDWQRMTDDDKVAFLDSTKAAMTQARQSMTVSGEAHTASAGGEQRTMVMSTIGGGGGSQTSVGNSGAPMSFVDASELPDYRPVFGANSVKADLEDNLWIRTSAARAGTIAGPIYDVVNRKGALVDRVQLPAGRTIVGFGKGGVVYMVARDDTGSWIERTHR